jgi:hypothetical protein
LYTETIYIKDEQTNKILNEEIEENLVKFLFEAFSVHTEHLIRNTILNCLETFYEKGYYFQKYNKYNSSDSVPLGDIVPLDEVNVNIEITPKMINIDFYTHVESI